MKAKLSLSRAEYGVRGGLEERAGDEERPMELLWRIDHESMGCSEFFGGILSSFGGLE